MKWVRILQSLFWVQVGVNLVGALGPELSFDALWYHLPIARLIAERGWWGVIPGGLFYYSGLPRFLSFIYAGLLWVGNSIHMTSPEILPKVWQWVFGIFCSRLIYIIAKKYMSAVGAWSAVLLWYTTLVVGWQSIVAYVDLTRTFFVLLGIWYLLTERWVRSAFALGLSYSVKLLGGIDAFMLIILVLIWKRNWRVVLLYIIILTFFLSVWGVLNLVQGYGFWYPLFAHGLLAEHWSWGWRTLSGPLLEMLDPRMRVGPIVLLLLLFGWRTIRYSAILRPLAFVSVSLMVSWYITPRSWDGRYFLPALALLSMVGVGSFFQTVSRPWYRPVLLVLVCMQSLVGIGYRAIANAKFVPVLLGHENKDTFLATHLNFSYGDWYDTDGWVRDHLAQRRYLVIGVHNTYYLPGKEWEHESWVQPGSCFPYVLVQGGVPPDESWILIHAVSATHTSIYKNSACLDVES